jgi:hypothetical protein
MAENQAATWKYVTASETVLGRLKQTSFDVTLTNGYPNTPGVSWGYPVAVQQNLGMAVVFNPSLKDNTASFSAAPSGYTYEYDFVHNSIRVMAGGNAQNPMIECSSGTNLSGVVVRANFQGSI